ncbi:helix-turn-helix domain-containing protein [Nonomuraea africana]|uniref:Helix-turn-helix domain-containing protein n=1 Tax=Nonomuraea africana TaxID=46171 RepID=A0ABR9KX03_9ACTN|nr:helix-turn-helix domain-containing protein [Nonomuraea africana]MBE1566572.1 hypothetical protein [Nonomuraea africana]
MSVEAISWALNLAPIPKDGGGKPNSACAFVLVGLANNADSTGRDAFPSVNTLVRYTRLSERTVRTALDRLAEEGVIREGDQAIVAAKIKRGDRRPQVWDLSMELIRDDLDADDLESLERTFPGITARYATVRPAETSRGAAVAPRAKRGANDGTGCNQRSNGVQPAHERGAVVAPDPSIDPSIDPSSSSPAVGGSPTGGRRLEVAAVPAGSETPAATKADREQARNAPRVAPAAAVFAALPEDLRRRISRGASGQVLTAIQRELATRTPAELVERVERRWTWWLHTNEHARVNDPVAAAITLVRARQCANARCEDGQDLDQGGDCPACQGGAHRTDTPPPSTPPTTTSAAAPAPTPAALGTPIPPSWQDRLKELAAITAIASDDETPRPRPQKAPVERGDVARAAITAARAVLGPKTPTAHEKDLQQAKQIYCETCGADEGSWCLNTDQEEMPLLNKIHPKRVQAARASKQQSAAEESAA